MQLVRLAKKLPLEILRMVEPKSKYKSPNNSFVTEAYFNAFIRFCEVICQEKQNRVHTSLANQFANKKWPSDEKHDYFKPTLTNLELYPNEFFQFIAICFPKNKLNRYINIFRQGSVRFSHCWFSGSPQNSAFTSVVRSHSQVLKLNEFDSLSNFEMLRHSMKLRDSTSKDHLIAFAKINKMYNYCLSLIYALAKPENLSEGCETQLKEIINLWF
jgi:hypothetical protein